MTPSPAVINLTFHPSWLISSMADPLWDGVFSHKRKPATMSSLIFSERTNRVVDRPLDLATLTSSSLESLIAENLSSFDK